MFIDKNGNKLPHQKWYSATDSQVQKSVDTWMEDHPEALKQDAKININRVSIETSKKLLDAISCVADIEIKGDSCEVWIYGKNRLPNLPIQSIESNGVTISVDENGRIHLNGTCTSNGANGFLYYDKKLRLEPNEYYYKYKHNLEVGNVAIQIGALGLRDTSTEGTIFKTTTTSETNASNLYIGITNLVVGTVLDDVIIEFDAETEVTPTTISHCNFPQVITQTSKVYIERGSEIAVFGGGKVSVTYACFSPEYQEITKGGIVEKNIPNPDWWGWNLPDGDAFFRYNCNPNYWQQYKEVVGPMLVRGQLVVGKNKPSLGGNGYDSSVPARYGFHIFEGVGYEADGKRVTILGGKFKDTASMFYFKTPYDGDDENLEGSASYGWLQLGTDNGRLGFWVKDDNTRLHSPLVFDVRQHDIETTTETIEIDSKHYNAEVRTEEKYPVGTMYYNRAMGKVRVRTENGWKSLSFEE